MVNRCLVTAFLLVANSDAWTTRNLLYRQQSTPIVVLSSSFGERSNEAPTNGQSRRQWLRRVAQAAASPFLLTSVPALAETDVGLAPLKRQVIVSPAVCDSTVSVWKEPNRNRLVYILGTAHISKISADLAGQLVRDVHPEAVFVELDLKRVGGIVKNAQQSSRQEALHSTEANGQAAVETSGMTYSSPTTTVVVPTVPPNALPTASNVPAPMEPQERGFLSAIRQRALSFGASAIGSAVRGMYQNLGDAGFSPGEEFAEAILEGQKIGASVILGDQDVEVTLRRLTQALAVTDLNRLNDEELQSKLNQIMPGGGQQLSPTMPSSEKMNQEYKEELAAFVETLKSRDNVRAIMTQLREVAPALAQVMLTERDVYMATGIDTLNQFGAIVAVMGIAHMDGVEQNLRSKGWQPVALRCPVR